MVGILYKSGFGQRHLHIRSASCVVPAGIVYSALSLKHIVSRLQTGRLPTWDGILQGCLVSYMPVAMRSWPRVIVVIDQLYQSCSRFVSMYIFSRQLRLTVAQPSSLVQFRDFFEKKMSFYSQIIQTLKQKQNSIGNQTNKDKIWLLNAKTKQKTFIYWLLE